MKEMRCMTLNEKKMSINIRYSIKRTLFSVNSSFFSLPALAYKHPPPLKAKTKKNTSLNCKFSSN